MVKRFLLLALMLIATAAPALAQALIQGWVADAKTGEKIPFANVVFPGGNATRTDVNGHFSMPFRAGKVRVSVIGYETRNFTVKEPNDSLVFKIEAIESALSTAVVTGKKEKYSRKNNPAVELMKKVIAAKKKSNLKEQHDYYSINKYTKMTLAFNEVTDKVFEEGKFKRLPFLKEHVEVCNETGKLILPISVDETVTHADLPQKPGNGKEHRDGTAEQWYQRTVQHGRHPDGYAEGLLYGCGHLPGECATAAIPFLQPYLYATRHWLLSLLYHRHADGEQHGPLHPCGLYAEQPAGLWVFG